MGILFDQDIITRNYENEIFEEGKAEGMQQGIQQGMQQGMEQGMQQGMEQGIEKGIEQGMQQGIEQGELEAFVKIYKKGMIKASDAAKMLNITVTKFLDLVKEK